MAQLAAALDMGRCLVLANVDLESLKEQKKAQSAEALAEAEQRLQQQQQQQQGLGRAASGSGAARFGCCVGGLSRLGGSAESGGSGPGHQTAAAGGACEGVQLPASQQPPPQQPQQDEVVSSGLLPVEGPDDGPLAAAGSAASSLATAAAASVADAASGIRWLRWPTFKLAGSGTLPGGEQPLQQPDQQTSEA